MFLGPEIWNLFILATFIGLIWFLIESGLHVKCIKERDGFTVDNLYKIESSQVNYNGFLEVRIINDKGLINTLPYSPHFQEISKKREDMLSFIGI